MVGGPGSTELVIFDCDGVLVDSEFISARVLLARLASVGVSADVTHFQAHFLGRSWPKVAADIRRNHGLALDDDFEESYRRELLAAFEAELALTPGVRAVLDHMAVPYCLATSSTPKRLARTLALTGLDAYFGERCFTASQVENGKPAPDLFLLAARMMGADPARCLVIEDSLPGIEAARRAGMRCRRYVGGQHFTGLDMTSTDDADKEFRFADWDSFFDLEPDLRARAGE